ncbi:extracellular catalytic domain type 1 short-chain-length polyhydroxyalkanoate depolymerase [Aquimarina litoralis]|uniref:extracellular catalytic domain type 1 short-chain-length polyhydroxyalkanoate depolymerase n=1 Tax=Aquimarina litoralis TaxID=584605 RepID=UPI001C575934|nr:T9SS type A sorting domain-containing protein [Aquimarina litoralis]MBW1295998.1 T9SS type A sorting domain-containing protein [Aquimarina litoralis]
MNVFNYDKASYFLKTTLIAFLFISFLSHAQQTLTNTLMHDGIQREYILYVPASYTGSTEVPLVFNFHGYGSNHTQQMNYGDFRPIADREGFLIVHPLGTVDNNGSTHFNVGWGTSSVDDVGFTSALIDEISSNYTINPKRIYSTGMSNGGFMSYRLACELSDKIAAVASVTGTMTVGQQNNCTTSHTMPIMEIHGTNDTTVPYNGNAGFESVQNVLDFWINAANTVTTITTYLDDINTTDNSTVEHYAYADGDNGVSIEHFKIINGGHTWPGSAFEIGPVTNKDINASEEIWKFFSRYTIDGAQQLSVDDFSGNDPTVKVYPNPTSSYLTINSNFSEALSYTMYSVSGNVVSTGEIDTVDQKIDMTSLSSGVYFLTIKNSSYKILKTE